MVLDYSCFQEQPNKDVTAFLEKASIRKITISQQSKACEIFLACPQLPDSALYLQCLQFFSNNMQQANGLRLVVQPVTSLSGQAFLENNFSLFVTMLQQQHPTISGWLYNSYWQLD